MLNFYFTERYINIYIFTFSLYFLFCLFIIFIFEFIVSLQCMKKYKEGMGFTLQCSAGLRWDKTSSDETFPHFHLVKCPQCGCRATCTSLIIPALFITAGGSASESTVLHCFYLSGSNKRVKNENLILFDITKKHLPLTSPFSL